MSRPRRGRRWWRSARRRSASLEDVQRIGRELRPEALDDLGLVNALIALCSRMNRQEGLRVHRELDWHLPALSPEVELVIYRVAQEALTNVAAPRPRHRGYVSLAAQGRSSVVLMVSDNGRGLPAGPTIRRVRGMRERAMVITPSSRSPPARVAGPTSCSRSHSGLGMPTPLKTRVLLADDHAVVRSGLRAVLDGEPDIEVVAEAADGMRGGREDARQRRRPRDPRRVDAAAHRAAGHRASCSGARRRCGY